MEAHPRPSDKIEYAITEFYRRYYPDESVTTPDRPWTVHKTATIAELKAKVAQHELTWHWRLLLPCLRFHKTEFDRANSIVLCVSQIRQWQLVSCFAMKWPDVDTEALPCALRSAGKTLLRPPVFGKSHRITRWEVYAALYDPHVKASIEQALVEAGNDSWRLAHILGRHDTYFRVSNPRQEADLLKLDIEQVVDLEPEHAPLDVEGEISPNPCRPYGGASVPLFSEATTDLPYPEEILFSSDNYCRAFEQVSDVINDAGARAVLVIAPPGSGKEKLCEMLHLCRRHTGKCITVSLAGLDAAAASYYLFNLSNHQAIEHRFDTGPGGLTVKKDFKAEFMDGAYFKALGGTVVLDELDKTGEDVRSILLRLIENDQVCIPNTALTVAIPPQSRPLLVLAGSRTRKEFMQLAPIDLWSRMTHVVEMQHPLALGEDADKVRVTEDYLRLFWLKQVQQCFREEGLLKKGHALYEPVRERFCDWWRLFSSRPVGDFVANEIAKALCGQGQALSSVRTLRGTMTRCFNLMFQSLLYHRNGDAPLEAWRAAHGTDPKFDPTSKLQLLIKNAMQSDVGRTFSNEEMRALDEVRALVRSSASIQV